jgi:hypothetical protein
VYKTLLSISLCIAPLWLGAQTAEDYFHGGAQSYIWGRNQEAKTNIITGIRRFPDDPLLKGMAELLNKKEQQQQQQQQQQQDQQKQQKQQGQQQQSEQNQQQKKEDEQKQAAKKPDQQKQDQQQAQQQAGQPKDKTDEQQQEGEPAQAMGQMTPEQAQKLLDAQKGDEQMLPLKPTGKPADHSKPIKDW